MMDVVRKAGDEINVAELSRELGCKIVEMSALRVKASKKRAEVAVAEAKPATQSLCTSFREQWNMPCPYRRGHLHHLPEERQRWYAIKIFERDERVD